MRHVLILMATYNGERYLRAQLDSILAQTHVDWVLLVRDDGSSDATISILEAYKAKDSRIEFTVNTTGPHGAFLNFHALIRMAKARADLYDAFAFCDQDDQWHPKKLERMLDRMGGSSPEPLMAYSDFSTMDESGNILVKSQQRLSDMRVRGRVDGLFLRKVWGCTMLINRALLVKVPSTPKKNESILAHDVYFEVYAMLYGRALYVEDPLVLYRRHGGNVSMLYNDLQRPNLIRKLADFTAYSSRLAQAFMLSESILEEILTFDPGNVLAQKAKRAICRGGFGAVLFCMRNQVSCGRIYKTAALYAALAMGSYKPYLDTQRAGVDIAS